MVALEYPAVVVEDGCPENSCRHARGITAAGKNKNKQRISKPWFIVEHRRVLGIKHINFLNVHAFPTVGQWNGIGVAKIGGFLVIISEKDD